MSSLSQTPARDTGLRTTFTLALVTFVLLAGLDVLTTSVMLASGMQEGNPTIRAIIAHGGMAGFALVKLTSSGAEIGFFLLTYLWLPGRWRWLTVAALLGADAWLLIVDGHNLLLALAAAGFPI